MILVFAAAYAALGILFAPATVIIEDYYRSKYLGNSLDLLDSFAIGLLSLAGAWIILIPYNVHLIAKRRKINR